MPVYYNDLDAMREFIEGRIDENTSIVVDTSYFLTWLYAGDSYKAVSGFAEYTTLMSEIKEAFPNVKNEAALATVTEVFVSREREWLGNWAEYIKSSPIKVNRELMLDYDPSLPDC